MINIKTILNWTMALALAMSLATVAACSKDKDKDDKAGQNNAAENTATPPVAVPATTPEPEIADEDLPVETDFEDEAEAQITADNFLQELDSLEKEITAPE